MWGISGPVGRSRKTPDFSQIGTGRVSGKIFLPVQWCAGSKEVSYVPIKRLILIVKLARDVIRLVREFLKLFQSR
jgi:hypothetical protein